MAIFFGRADTLRVSGGAFRGRFFRGRLYTSADDTHCRYSLFLLP